MTWISVTEKSPISNALYVKANDLGEKFSKIIFFVAIQCSVPALILPKAVVSYFIYFTTDSGGDAFDLQFPIWYVLFDFIL